LIVATVLAAGLALMQGPPPASSAPVARPLTAPPKKQVFAARVVSGAIQVDGRLDDAAWTTARWIEDFTQKMPVEGAPPSDSMRIAILYDDHAVYVGARMRSRDPAQIQSPLSRRDNTSQAEHLWVSFDTYHDRRTAYSFGVTASGVRMDWYHPTDNETDIDGTFDPVWEARAVIDDQGWTTEMQIPFSQLRFNDQPDQVWGFNADHWIPAHNEDVFWIPVPTNQTGWSSWMGELVGISGVKPSRRLELMPYVAGNSTLTGARDPRNPFDDGKNFAARAGGDLKMGLGPSITLDATVNPDFGQVEADPAVVNLSAFEVFFDERRPFFTEGSQLLRGNGPSYFYSRRIGGPPRGSAGGDFVDYPNTATILGAAKVTGRLASGFSLGALGAVTGRETARTVVFDSSGVPSFGRTQVTPPAGYGVVRAQQEFGANASVIGVTLTGVARDLPGGDPLATLYTHRAVAGGADWVLRWDRGAYEVRGWIGFSRIEGAAPAIDRVQRSAVHFFQRPDADYAHYDPQRTSLTGTIANFEFSKNSGRHWLYSFGSGWESPAYDPNDAGRLGNADGRFGYLNLRFRETQPSRSLQNYEVGVYSSAEWDFGGDRQYLFAELYENVTLRNFWRINSYFDFFPRSFDHAATRGGPTMRSAQSWNVVTQLLNNFGAKTSWNARVYYGQDELGGETYRLSGGLSIRPGPRWQLSVTPNYLRDIAPRQYLDSAPNGPAATYGTRYLFAFIDQSTFLMQLRLNYTLRPELTLDLYAEPFAASGRYYGLGELAAARGFGLRRYGTGGTTIARDPDGNYTITDGADTILVGNPDFNVLSFRSNAVLRWEWRPGSTLFLVWQQNRFGFDTRGAHVGPRDLWDSFRATGDNFLAIKASYWFSVQ
jgi:hypothetical protein